MAKSYRDEGPKSNTKTLLIIFGVLLVIFFILVFAGVISFR